MSVPLHEAGHLVVRWVLGERDLVARLGPVTIDGFASRGIVEPTAGATNVLPAPAELHAACESRIYLKLVGVLAGWAAEHVWVGLQAAPIVVLPATSADAQAAVAYASELGRRAGGPMDVQLQSAWEESVRLVERNWPTLCDLADRLAVDGRLMGDEALAAVELSL